MKSRTKLFALRVIKVFKNLPKEEEAQIIGKQLLRSATSVGANYRAACRARSDAEYFSKMCIVVEEVDESAYWMELLIEAETIPATRLESLLNETNELLAIFASSRKTLKEKR